MRYIWLVILSCLLGVPAAVAAPASEGVTAAPSTAASIEKGAEHTMGVLVIVAYRPRHGMEEKLVALTREHVPALRAQGLATDRPAYAMRAADGTIIEVFEWKSKEAMAAAHSNPAVQEMWKRYGEVCEFVPLSKLKEAGEMFAGFEPIDL